MLINYKRHDKSDDLLIGKGDLVLLIKKLFLLLFDEVLLPISAK